MHNLALLARKTKTFINIENRIKFEFIQAYIYSGIARAYILFIPFNKLKKRMGKQKKESMEKESSDVYKVVKRIRWSVLKAARCTPWDSKCLVQALTAQWMLKRKKISSTIYLGVRKEGNEMKAHAWLRCGEMYVTGGEIRKDYTVVAKFAN